MLKSILFLNSIRKSQWFNYRRIEEIQKIRLKKILEHAYKNVKYYHKLFGLAGLQPNEINDAFDLSKIPVTSRAQLQNLSPDEIISKDHEVVKLIKLRTSGSTGMPLNIFISKSEARVRGIFSLRMLLEDGYKVTDKTLTIMDNRHFNHKKRYFQHCGIMREVFVSPFLRLDKQFEIYKTFQPHVIKGYSSCIEDLAFKVNKDVETYYPELIFCTGEVLNKSKRDFIKRIFNSEVFNYYSAMECGNIAWECPSHTGYHINSEGLIVECINKNGKKAINGEKGKIVITSLYSYAMPLIRYEIGDIIYLSDKPCSCGRTLPLIECIEGRIADYLISNDGSKISSYLLEFAIEEMPEIKKYQVIQESVGKITVEIIKDNSITSEILSKTEKILKKMIGGTIVINFAMVDSIDKNPSGKFRTVISNLRGDHVS